VRTRSKADAIIINELRQIGVDIKGLPIICHTISKEQLDTLISSIVEAISRIGQGREGK
jgi:regulator of RNase E activity RraB